MNIIRTLAFFIATAAVAVAAPQHAVDPNSIKDKVSITLGQKFHLKFRPEGDQLLQPAKFKGTDDNKATVTVKLDVTSASPIRPPREGATRPFLAVHNGFERTLHYRALARLKGSREYFEIGAGMEPVPPGEGANKCWEFGSLVEEVVLYQLTLLLLHPQPRQTRQPLRGQMGRRTHSAREEICGGVIHRRGGKDGRLGSVDECGWNGIEKSFKA